MSRLFRKQIKIDDDTLLYLSLIYMYIPIVIFLLMWTKPLIGAVILLVSCVCLVALVNDTRKRREKLPEGPKLQTELRLFVLLILALLIFGYYMGWSGGAPQTGDWNKHNAVLHDMVKKDWPVYYFYGEYSMLTYYIAQYIVPALIGKLFGGSFLAAQIGMYIWNMLGLILVFFWLLVVTRAVSKKRQIFTLLSLFFFGGMLPLAQFLMTCCNKVGFFSQFDYYRFLNTDSLFLQYRTNYTSMRWVFQQCLVPWISVLMFLHYREERKHYVTMLLPSFLYAIMSFVGIVFLAFSYAVVRLITGENRKKILFEIISPYNIALAATLGTVILIYYSGNVFSEKPDWITLSFAVTSARELVGLVLFEIFMFGIHFLLMRKYYRKEPLYYITLATLIIIPFFKMGMWNDFCMGVSIAPLMLFMVLVIRYLFDNRKCADERIRIGIMYSALFVGALYPVMDLSEVIRADSLCERETMDQFGSMRQYACRDKENVGDDLMYNYFTYDLDDSLFVNYIANEKYEKIGVITDEGF